jgi:hypothetical protein
MGEQGIQQTKLRMKEMTTEELLDIWQKHDTTEWTADAFRAVEEVLTERGVDNPCDCEYDLRPQAEASREASRKILKENIATLLKILVLICSIFSIICLALLVIWFIQTIRRPENKVIFTEVRPLFEQCKSIGDSTAISLRGHALVLDMDTGDDFTGWRFASDISKMTFPRANTFDREITVFLVSEQEQEYLGDYHSTNPSCSFGFNKESLVCKGASAYRARYDVCAVYWPERQAVGMKTLFSNPPGEAVIAFSLYSVNIVGEPKDVYSWIGSLPTTE